MQTAGVVVLPKRCVKTSCVERLIEFLNGAGAAVAATIFITQALACERRFQQGPLRNYSGY